MQKIIDLMFMVKIVSSFGLFKVKETIAVNPWPMTPIKRYPLNIGNIRRRNIYLWNVLIAMEKKSSP